MIPIIITKNVKKNINTHKKFNVVLIEYALNFYIILKLL